MARTHDKTPLLRVPEVATELGVSAGRVYQLISAGLIPSVRINRSVRIPRRAWEVWLREQANAALRPLRRGSDLPADDRDS
jgi:excisionase family DNA binding protein